MSDMTRPSARPSRRAARSRGQSLVELALILPILLTMAGAAIDLARVYSAYLSVESAARNAAEQVASDSTIASSGAATTKAKTVVCTEMQSFAGFVPGANLSSCTQPNVSVTWSAPVTTTPTASTTYPLGSATVTVTFPFQTLFAYPLFTQGGAWTLSSTQTFSVIQNRT
jgi:Flp pilus assembly protein TadG